MKKKKENRGGPNRNQGRKKLNENDRKVPLVVTAYVKKKHYTEAKKAIQPMSEKIKSIVDKINKK
jgi:hypothetical protein